jgi:hypothetical protein
MKNAWLAVCIGEGRAAWSVVSSLAEIAAVDTSIDHHAHAL